MLNRFIAGFIGFFLLSYNHAEGSVGNNFRILPMFLITDTADKKGDTLIQNTPADPKQAFRDMFIANSATSGVYSQKLNPQAISFVDDYVDKFGEEIESIKDWGRPYLDLMEKILVQHGLPKELKYLAVIESNLKSNARSAVGAAGPWQFMPETARNMGLKVGKGYDERRDFAKSTQAASRYLSDLYQLYGDWLLVIAAYNGGAGKINSAIKRSGSRDFWTLQRYLPTESKNHVKKFIATHYIMEGGGGITTSTKEEAKNISVMTTLSPEEAANSKTQSITGRYNSGIIAKFVTMDIAEFNKMNPDFDRLIASGNSYEMRLPGDKMEIFMARRPEILNESMQLLLRAANY